MSDEKFRRFVGRKIGLFDVKKSADSFSADKSLDFKFSTCSTAAFAEVLTLFIHVSSLTHVLGLRTLLSGDLLSGSY